MDYQDMFIPIDADEDLYMNSDIKNQKVINDLQSENKHFHREVKRIKTKSGKKNMTIEKNVTIEYYSSGPINTTITHAITGSRERGNLVGSVYEDLFFKVCITTGDQPFTLFYYSPEEYEKHHYIQLSSDIKEKWVEKYLKASVKLRCKNE